MRSVLASTFWSPVAFAWFPGDCRSASAADWYGSTVVFAVVVVGLPLVPDDDEDALMMMSVGWHSIDGRSAAANICIWGRTRGKQRDFSFQYVCCDNIKHVSLYMWLTHYWQRKNIYNIKSNAGCGLHVVWLGLRCSAPEVFFLKFDVWLSSREYISTLIFIVEWQYSEQTKRARTMGKID